MARGRFSLAHALLLGLLAPLVAANAEANSEAHAEAPPSGSSEGLAYEPIEKAQTFTDNATAATQPRRPPVDGWWESRICADEFCIYTNRWIAKGRGIVMVTKLDDYQKVAQIEDTLNTGENKYEQPVSFVETEVVDKGIGITANKTIRRGKPLMSWTPVLLVHRDFFKEVDSKKERKKMLETAVGFLPDETRKVFDRQRKRPDGKKRSIEKILHAYPFEVNLGGFSYRPEDHSRHLASYPEMAVLQHDCRPNVAYYIDDHMAIRTTVARRVQVGDELTISYIDPMMERAERQEWVKKHRGFGKPCSCSYCTQGNKPEELKKSDERMEELTKIRSRLRNHDTKDITFDEIERYLQLMKQERLDIRLAEAYENAALNFNYLGDDKRAKKYADMAVQAGIVEGGPQSNDAVAMRVMASDIKGHYSYQFTLKRRGAVPPK